MGRHRKANTSPAAQQKREKRRARDARKVERSQNVQAAAQQAAQRAVQLQASVAAQQQQRSLSSLAKWELQVPAGMPVPARSPPAPAPAQAPTQPPTQNAAGSPPRSSFAARSSQFLPINQANQSSPRSPPRAASVAGPGTATVSKKGGHTRSSGTPAPRRPSLSTPLSDSESDVQPLARRQKQAPVAAEAETDFEGFSTEAPPSPGAASDSSGQGPSKRPRVTSPARQSFDEDFEEEDALPEEEEGREKDPGTQAYEPEDEDEDEDEDNGPARTRQARRSAIRAGKAPATPAPPAPPAPEVAEASDAPSATAAPREVDTATARFLASQANFIRDNGAEPYDLFPTAFHPYQVLDVAVNTLRAVHEPLCHCQDGHPRSHVAQAQTCKSMATLLTKAKGRVAGANFSSLSTVRASARHAFPLHVLKPLNQEQFDSTLQYDPNVLFNEASHRGHPLSLDLTEKTALASVEEWARLNQPPLGVRRHWDIDSIYFEPTSLGAFQHCVGFQLCMQATFQSCLTRNSYCHVGEHGNVQPHKHKNVLLGTVAGFPTQGTVHLVFPFFDNNAPFPLDDLPDALPDEEEIEDIPDSEVEDLEPAAAPRPQTRKGRMTNALNNMAMEVYYQECFLPAFHAAVPDRAATQSSHSFSQMQTRTNVRRTASLSSSHQRPNPHRSQVLESVPTNALAHIWDELLENCNRFPQHFGKPVLVFQAHNLKQATLGDSPREVLLDAHDRYLKYLTMEFLAEDRFWVDWAFVDTPEQEGQRSPSTAWTLLYKRGCMAHFEASQRRAARTASVEEVDLTLDPEAGPSAAAAVAAAATATATASASTSTASTASTANSPTATAQASSRQNTPLEGPDPDCPLGDFQFRTYLQNAIWDTTTLDITPPPRESRAPGLWPVTHVKMYNTHKNAFRSLAREEGAPFAGGHQYELLPLTLDERKAWAEQAYRGVGQPKNDRSFEALSYNGLNHIFYVDGNNTSNCLKEEVVRGQPRPYHTFGVRREVTILYSVLAKIPLDPLVELTQAPRPLRVAPADEAAHRPFFTVPTEDYNNLLLSHISRFFLASHRLLAYAHHVSPALAVPKDTEGEYGYFTAEQRYQAVYTMLVFFKLLLLCTSGATPEIHHRWLWLPTVPQRDRRRTLREGEEDREWAGLNLSRSCRRLGLPFFQAPQWVFTDPVSLSPEHGIQPIGFPDRLRALRAASYQAGAPAPALVSPLSTAAFDARLNAKVEAFYKELNDSFLADVPLEPVDFWKGAGSPILVAVFTLELQRIVVAYNHCFLTSLRSAFLWGRERGPTALSSMAEVNAAMRAVGLYPSRFSTTRCLSILDLDALWASIYSRWDQARFQAEEPEGEAPVMPRLSKTRSHQNVAWGEFCGRMLQGNPVRQTGRSAPPPWSKRRFVKLYQQANVRWQEAIASYRWPRALSSYFSEFVLQYAGQFIFVTPNFDQSAGRSAQFLVVQQSAYKPGQTRGLYLSVVVPGIHEEDLLAPARTLAKTDHREAFQQYGYLKRQPELTAKEMGVTHLALRVLALEATVHRPAVREALAQHNETSAGLLSRLTAGLLRTAADPAEILVAVSTLRDLKQEDPPKQMLGPAKLLATLLRPASPPVWTPPSLASSHKDASSYFECAFVPGARHEPLARVKPAGRPLLGVYGTSVPIALPCLGTFLSGFLLDSEEATDNPCRVAASFTTLWRRTDPDYYYNAITGQRYGYDYRLDEIHNLLHGWAQAEVEGRPDVAGVENPLDLLEEEEEEEA